MSKDLRVRVARLGVAALLTAMMTVGLATASLARPTRSDLSAARAELFSMNHRLELLVEQYDQTKFALQQAQQRLAAARATASAARARALRARKLLDARARAAYESAGSEIAVVLEATSLSDLTDRVQFIGSVAANDVRVANAAQARRQAALAAGQRLTALIQHRAAILDSLAQRKQQVLSGIATQQALIDRLQRELSRPVVQRLQQQPPPPPAAPRIQLAAPTPSSAPPPPPGGSVPGDSRAAIAVRAAYSALGTPYQWGGSTPGVGMDCSGLTMWAWGQAGVSLPHSAALQYSVIPHVSQSQLMPGDLLFFYTPISHVGMYVGNGSMIDEATTGTVASVRPIFWQYFVGAGRP